MRKNLKWKKMCANKLKHSLQNNSLQKPFIITVYDFKTKIVEPDKQLKQRK